MTNDIKQIKNEYDAAYVAASTAIFTSGSFLILSCINMLFFACALIFTQSWRVLKNYKRLENM
jgi:hypothetical protein